MSPQVRSKVNRARRHAAAAGGAWSGRTWGMALLLVGTVVAVFGQVVGHEFLEYDDDVNVYRNPYLRPVSWSHVAAFWRAPYEALYVPVAYTFFAAEAAISAGRPVDAAGRAISPVVFHAGSVALHAVCVLLVFALLRRLVGGEAPALAGAAVFALHPLQVESVAWISETRGLLSACLGLAALWCYVRFAEGANERSRGRRRAVYYTAAAGLYVLALLSKPSAAAIPLVAAAIDVGLLRRRVAASAMGLAPWVALAAVVALVSRSQQPGIDLPSATLAERVCVAGDALVFYGRKVIWPAHLTPIYDRPLDRMLAERGLCWAWLAVVGCVAVAALVPGRRWSLLSLAIFAGALAPQLGLVPFDFQRLSIVADRYAYLAMLGPALGAAACCAAYPGRATFAGCLTVAAVLAWLSFRQVRHWRDDATFFGYVAAENPASAEAHNSLGNVAVRRQDVQAAEAHYRRALEIRPRHALAHRNLGLVLVRRGRIEDAIAHYRQAIEARPDYADAYRSLGHAQYQAGDLAGAADAYARAIKAQVDYRAVYEELGVTLLKLGRPAEAEAHYRRTIGRFPNWAHAHANLAVALAQQGKYDEAAAEARRALAIDPAMADARDTLDKVERLLQSR